jgi:hypothetical protein
VAPCDPAPVYAERAAGLVMLMFATLSGKMALEDFRLWQKYGDWPFAAMAALFVTLTSIGFGVAVWLILR